MSLATGDVLSVMSQGLFKDSAVTGTYPAVSLVYYNTQYGPTGTEYTGTLHTPPDNPVTESGWDDEFEADIADMFDTDQGAVNVTYYSDALGVSVPIVAIFMRMADAIKEYDVRTSRKRDGECWVKLSDIAEPRPAVDTITHDGVTWTVLDNLGLQGGVWQLRIQEVETDMVRGIDRRVF